MQDFLAELMDRYQTMAERYIASWVKDPGIAADLWPLPLSWSLPWDFGFIQAHRLPSP